MKLAVRTGHDWQLTCGSDDHDHRESWSFVHFGHLVEQDADVGLVPSLIDGQAAERLEVGAQWAVIDFRWTELVEEIRNDQVGIATLQDDGLPTLGYSVGLHAGFGQPELCCMGLPPGELLAMLRHVAGLIVAGSHLDAYSATRVVYPDVDVFVLPVPPAVAKEWLPYAVRHADEAGRLASLRVLQLVWPDNDFRFPWDRLAGSKLRELQPVLGSEDPVTQAWIRDRSGLT